MSRVAPIGFDSTRVRSNQRMVRDRSRGIRGHPSAAFGSGLSQGKGENQSIRSGRLEVGLVDYLDDRFLGFRLPEESDEAVVLEVARDVFQGT